MKSKLILLLAVALLAANQSCDNAPEPSDVPEGNPLNFTAASGTILTIAGQGPSAFDYSGDGELATDAKLDFVTGVSVDQSGNVYTFNGASNTVRKIYFSTGTIQTYGGVFLGWNVTDPTPLHGDNGPAADAHMSILIAGTVDVNGNVIVLDAGNAQVREIRASDSTIHKVGGGNAWNNFGGDGGLATTASFNNAYGVATDASGNIYIADEYNNSIRKIDQMTGIISTVAGKGPDHAGYSGDNSAATSAMLNLPRGVAVDNDGNIFIADSQNNVIRKVSNGIITTIAGTGLPGYSGDGALAINAKINYPQSITVDNEGTIYFTDMNNNVIRKVDNSGIITTYVGTGASGYKGDGGLATKAKINYPWGIAVDSDGNLYIADTNNAAIRVVIK
jgi:trimeric autotransporter adhesin